MTNATSPQATIAASSALPSPGSEGALQSDKTTLEPLEKSAGLTPPLAPRAVTPMAILVEQLTAIAARAAQGESAAALQASLQQTIALAAGLDPYLSDCASPESPALAALAQKTAAEDWSRRFSDQETVHALEQEMLSGHVEGQTLKLFVQMTRARRILEVGMFTGYSALAMAEALPDDGLLLACEMDAYVAQFAQTGFAASPHGRKIQVKVAPALQTLAALAQEQQSFDLVFIDANKEEYIQYFELLLNHNLVTPGGFICADNTLFQGQAYLPAAQRTANGAAIAAFNYHVAADERVEQVLLPLRDGLTIIRRKL